MRGGGRGWWGRGESALLARGKRGGKEKERIGNDVAWNGSVMRVEIQETKVN